MSYIKTNFNKNDDVSIFKRKRGKHDWDWENVGTYLLSKDNKIDMIKFFQDSYIVYENINEALTNDSEFIKEKFEEMNFDFIRNIMNQYENLNCDEDEIIVLNSNGDMWCENKYNSYYLDDDSNEWEVGVEIEE